MTPLATLGLGLLLGLKHAFDSDHLIAVSTFVTRERSPWRALWIGLSWGLGHTVTLLVVGLAVLGLHKQIPPPLGLSLECLVGVVLMGLFFSLATDRLHALHQGLRLAIGTLSTVCGAWMVVEIGFVQGLFL